jgi:LuxR family quorum sensing-dependent transcriptional regulator
MMSSSDRTQQAGALVIESDCRRTFELIDRLRRLTDPDAVIAEWQRGLQDFGAETLIMSGLPRRNQQLEDVVLGKRLPAGWWEVYCGEQYFRIDPVLQLVKCVSQPFRRSEVVYDPVRQPRVAELMRRRADFGIGDGFVVPIHRAMGQPAFASITGHDIEYTVSSKAALHLLAVYVHDRMRALASDHQAERPQLTPRERDVMAWVARGKSAREVGEILGIAKRTVDEHVGTVARKLGASNRTEAVAMALLERLIEP